MNETLEAGNFPRTLMIFSNVSHHEVPAAKIMAPGSTARVHTPPKTYEKEDQPTLVRKGQQLLEEFTALKARTEADMAGENKSVITRQLAPHRKQLARSLLSLARETDCTSGKWMLFPSPQNVNTVWSLIAHATVSGELGFAAKVATDDGSQRARLICIYTADFGDKDDVKRVLERILALGLCGGNGAGGKGKAIYYKADVYTYLDLMGGNKFGLKTSLFSSRDVIRRGK
ncbi:hypothetical protein N7G274_002188 [Stereocaulon virgatum]|uniref:DUF1917-domain-containing protein n=1 Tax=Stereocaulon virgatum TaxID=373712 RepID=A0ABR4AJ05_9LECA